jgi:phosphate/phosphite/phosphonate ABC transporter binding protein
MKRLAVVFCLVSLFVWHDSDAQAVIKIGMLAQRGSEIALKEWGGIAQYLTQQLGEEVQIVPLNFGQVLDFCWNEPQSFLFANSWFYIRAKVLRGAKALVTVKYQGSSPWFGGVIFVKADSPINSLSDLRQKRFMCVKYSSAGGWLFAKGVLVKDAGLNPEKDFSQLSEGRTHDAVVYAVRDGKVDAGTVRTNILETLQREGKIDMKQFRVIHLMKHPDFSEVCSTPLYPDWPVASLKGTPPDLAAKMRAALLALPPGHPALEQARKIDHFLPALDYGPLEDLLKTLKAEPFRHR